MYIIFSKISLFTFLIHLKLINYFACVILACILLFLQIHAQGLHMDKKLRTSSTSIWPMMLLLGSIAPLDSEACSRLRRRHGESEKLMIFWRGKNDKGVKFSLHLSKYTHNFARYRCNHMIPSYRRRSYKSLYIESNYVAFH